MKKIALIIAALSLISLGTFAQKKQKVKLSKADQEFLKTAADGLYAKLETNRGNIYAMLEFTQTPMTVANFVGLAEGTITNTAKPAGQPYYDGLIFHRVIPGFMIQGGCPLKNGTGDPGYKFPDELDKNLPIAKKGYTRGAMAMANAGPNTNGSQFFIMQKDYGLSYDYTLFGAVVKGIEVVDSIISTPRNPADRPNVDQTINHISILRKGKAAEAFDAAKTFEYEKANFETKKAAKLAAENAENEKALAEATRGFQKSASGLYYLIENPGEGAVMKPGDVVTVHCTGTLLNGTKFWSSHDGQGQPLVMPIGANPPRLIPGMEEGIMLLKQGGKAKLVIPPNMGYGERGSPPVIPPNSWLRFDVEVVKIGQ
jgi:peptidyl-prolyl cis-trans isomerase A (cyclophilin A)